MSKKTIKVSSVTMAAKARELLVNKGYKAYIARNPRPETSEGCGYVIYVGDYDLRCLTILQNSGIKVTGVFDSGDSV